MCRETSETLRLGAKTTDLSMCLLVVAENGSTFVMIFICGRPLWLNSLQIIRENIINHKFHAMSNSTIPNKFNQWKIPYSCVYGFEFNNVIKLNVVKNFTPECVWIDMVSVAFGMWTRKKLHTIFALKNNGNI